jgi:ribosome-associated toxin RatA of RatAB toxin-antitoxin module
MCLVFLFLPFLLRAADTRSEIAPGANFKQLINKPAVVYSGVDSYQEGKSEWVSMEADVHMCTDVPLAALKQAVTDYNNYTKIFSRMTDSKVRGEDENGLELFLQLSVGALGINIVTNYSILMNTETDEPDCFFLTFSHYSDDGTVRNINGSWYFKTVELDGKSYTYIRYYSASESLKQKALQKTAASLFINSEYTSMLKELVAAARKKI